MLKDMDVSVMVYIDDILIFSRDAEEHAEHVEWVLRAAAERLLRQPRQVRVLPSEGTSLVISEGGVAVLQHKVESIAKWSSSEL